MTQVLIVEDETALAGLERDYLTEAGYQVTCMARGDDAARWLAKNDADLIVLDLMLPGLDGLTLCRQLRGEGNTTPIIMTTARVEEMDRLNGLDVGADDYLCKPFSLRELVARVGVILRRVQPRADADRTAVTLNCADGWAQIGEQKVELTRVEANLLTALMHRPGQIWTRDQLIDQIYSDHRIVSDRTVDSHIRKLRRKLLALVPDHDFIDSVYGAGYRFTHYENKSA